MEVELQVAGLAFLHCRGNPRERNASLVGGCMHPGIWSRASGSAGRWVWPACQSKQSPERRVCQKGGA